MAQVQIVREFAADPASVALLLAGPSAQALWPDTGEDDGPVVTVGSPMRSGVGFVVDMAVADQAAGGTRGRLSLEPCTNETANTGTHARLVMTSVNSEVNELRSRGVEFLDALSSVAEARSFAA
jgi:ABC-type uncharacterized transport system substrate-binding protein